MLIYVLIDFKYQSNIVGEIYMKIIGLGNRNKVLLQNHLNSARSPEGFQPKKLAIAIITPVTSSNLAIKKRMTLPLRPSKFGTCARCYLNTMMK
jgi:hypothetical protein